MTSLPLPRAPCSDSLLLWLILSPAIPVPHLQAERADPFFFLISMHSVISHGEVQSHLPRPGSGVQADTTCPLRCKPQDPVDMCPVDWRRPSSAFSECLFLLPWLSLTVPWGFLFGCAGEWWKTEERHYGWDSCWVMEQIRLPLNGRSTQFFTLERPVLRLFRMQDKISRVPVACGGGCCWSKIYRLFLNVVRWACGLISPENIFLCSDIMPDTYNFPFVQGNEVFWVLN